MASMMQTFGYKHGIFFDPTTMETLLQNEAMAMAFSLLKVRLIAPTETCLCALIATQGTLPRPYRP